MSDFSGMEDLLQDFLVEATDLLSGVDNKLVELEKRPQDRGLLNDIFRGFHTIKGGAGFLNATELVTLCHLTENLFDKLRNGELGVTAEAMDVIMAATGTVREMFHALEQGVQPQAAEAGLIASLKQAIAGELAAAAAPAAAPAVKTTAGGALDWNAYYEAVTGRAPEVPAEAGQGIPQPPKPDEEIIKAAIGRRASDKPGYSGPTGRRESEKTRDNAIRVDTSRLDQVLNLSGEIGLTKNRLNSLRSDILAGMTGAETLQALDAAVGQLDLLVSDLQNAVMKTRMQPIGNAWNKLPRLVRDLARETGKRIELAMHGAETELDRQVLEFIKDPLTHMVRNSADHGLETAAERRAAGKPETGRITLNAFHEGGHIIIEIADDGRGLNTKRIAEKALAQGLASEAELAQMSEAAIQQFIFRAGFSTAAQVTAVSGRGVGMDVVKTNIEKIGGTIELASREGSGTTVTIKIPLTLAIVSALIVECAGERFAIPQISVVELVRTGGGSDTAIERINTTPVLRLRDRLLPLVRLSSLLALEEGEREEGGESFIVVAKVGTENFGLIVDRVFDTEEIVVKPVAPILRDITLFSGNTILGDGSVIMILDPNGIARAVGIGAAAGAERAAMVEAARAEAGGSRSRTSLLLFRAGGPEPKAVPLGLVARLEEIGAERIERAGARAMVQYRGQLMPLVPMGVDLDDPARTRRPVLVFSDAGRSMGLVVDEILDVVEDTVEIQLGSARPGILGSAVIAGRATEIIDTGHWLALAAEDWFATRRNGAGKARPHLLVIDDSAFFRHMLVPVLTAAGYEVTAAETADAALRLREQGRRFDAIVSDIEMPGMDGFAFARAVREDPRWASLPLVALTSRVAEADIHRGREAGFTDYVAKFDRAALLAGIAQVLATSRETETA